MSGKKKKAKLVKIETCKMLVFLIIHFSKFIKNNCYLNPNELDGFQTEKKSSLNSDCFDIFKRMIIYSFYLLSSIF